MCTQTQLIFFMEIEPLCLDYFFKSVLYIIKANMGREKDGRDNEYILK